MKCPKCKTTKLKQGTVRESGVEIDYCPACKGFWLNKGELEQICNVAIKELTVPRSSEKQAICPNCHEFLYSFHYPQTLVTIEMCKVCEGLWLDANELKEIKLVRQNLSEQKQLEEYDEIRGVKGRLIDFIENTITHLTSM